MQVANKGGASRLSGYVGGLFAAGITLAFARMVPAVQSGEVILRSWDWASSLGVSFAFMVDGLSLIFALLISGIGALIFLYATICMDGHRLFGRFMLYMFCFMVSMLGLVLASDLITIFVFWELTSFTSYLLIGFNHETVRARRNALQAMLLTAAGGLALLAAFVLIRMESGSYDLAAILRGPGLQDSGLYGAILVLVLLGAFTKSAQFPFHFWLPNAMAAPTPVSAYLHSATMVKAGVYLLARLHPVLGGTTPWMTALTAFGLVTAVMAALIALRQTDLKQALAYMTLMALGTITLFLGGDSPYALTAALVFLVVHSLYKAALFMLVGGIERSTGTRDITQLGGLGRIMPVTTAATVLAAASMAGLPPMLGWIGKELLYAGAVTMPAAPLAIIGVVSANALMFAVAGVIALRPFRGALPQYSRTPHEVPWQMLVGPLVLATLGLVFGLFAQTLLGPMVTATVTRSLGATHAAGLHLWGGINLPLALSLTTFTLGVVLYLARDRFRDVMGAILQRLPSFDAGWDAFLDAFRAFSTWQSWVIQTGKLGRYLFVVFAVMTAAIGGALAIRRPMIAYDFSAPLQIWLIVGFSIAGTLAAISIQSRITAIAGISTVGIGVSLIFIGFGAPDVAMTQLMIEALSAVMLGVALLHLPKATEDRTPRTRALHAVLAGGAGLAVTLVILAVRSHPLDRHLTTFFEENSHAVAHGLNVVNVILVDFRAFDTMGELTVVLLASIGAFAVLKQRSSRGKQ